MVENNVAPMYTKLFKVFTLGQFILYSSVKDILSIGKLFLTNFFKERPLFSQKFQTKFYFNDSDTEGLEISSSQVKQKL